MPPIPLHLSTAKLTQVLYPYFSQYYAVDPLPAYSGSASRLASTSESDSNEDLLFAPMAKKMKTKQPRSSPIASTSAVKLEAEGEGENQNGPKAKLKSGHVGFDADINECFPHRYGRVLSRRLVF